MTTPDFELRPADAADLDLLLRVYASTREPELARVDWTEQQKRLFVRSQFDAQHRDYHERYPDAQYAVIVAGGAPAGRMYVERRPEEILLVDIALLPEHRGAGIGSALLTRLLAEARACAKPLRIHVELDNPAQRLYRRLGFEPVEVFGLHVLMEAN
jgi:ribosomal protein S18 acetylase RimI-like enzyme